MSLAASMKILTRKTSLAVRKTLRRSAQGARHRQGVHALPPSHGGGRRACWAIAKSTDPEHKADSRVHRYDRVIGFLPSEGDQAEIDSTDAVKKAWEQRRQEAVKHKSHHR